VLPPDGAAELRAVAAAGLEVAVAVAVAAAGAGRDTFTRRI
jgi:hypothetical protein